MEDSSPGLPDHYRSATRVLLRYAVVMAVVGLLSGVVFQESAKRLDPGAVDAGLRLQATIHLALVHGHILVMCVVLPIALAGALFLARKAGGGAVGPRAVAFLTRGYLPLAVVVVALMLAKGYHVLLAVRGGETDLVAIDERFLFGVKAIRYAVYGVVHTGMAVTLVVFLVGLWRSLSRRPGQSG